MVSVVYAVSTPACEAGSKGSSPFEYPSHFALTGADIRPNGNSVMTQIKYTCDRPRESRRHYINRQDIETLLSRLPSELWARLHAVHFNDRSMGCRTLGYVNRGRREIAICALPTRVSLTRFLIGRAANPRLLRQSPTQFGAVRGQQWPELAVRRFMLYDVLLHELGHLQMVLPNARRLNRRYAGETKAQQFADHWRKALWAEPFNHPDPVHTPPTTDELQQFQLVTRVNS